MKTYLSSSSAETKKIAGEFAKKILRIRPKNRFDPAQRRHAVVVDFVGDLGAGKTTFIQGFLRALGVRGKITSPTFVLIKRYATKSKSKPYTPNPTPYHMDAYRLKNHRELEVLDFKKIISDPNNIVLIEWAEKVKKLLPKDTIWIKFRHGKKEHERRISFSK